MEISLAVVPLLVALLLGYLALRWYLIPKQKPALRTVAIIVLGDVGRSPRMMYHAESFAQNGFKTYIIGNKGSSPIPSLLTLPNIEFKYLPDPPKAHPGLPFIITAPHKIVQQVFAILDALLNRIRNPPEFILVQNPPSIPTLALVWLVGWYRGSKVIIDWHNLGWSILALKLGQSHPFVRIAQWFESYFGRTAYAHLFVTHAMRDRLVKDWQLQGKKVVLHDRPPAHFHRAAPSETHDLFLRLAPKLFTPSLQSFLPQFTPPYSTPFTNVPTRTDSGDVDFDVEADSPMPGKRPDRPALLLSSTSWTPDEDFGVLLDALCRYDVLARRANGKLPKVLMVVTGKGPDKDKYMRRIERLQGGADNDATGEHEGWKYVRCISAWLEAADYPLLLGSADIGISLHSSSSALDLPMKIVDMFGCGLPVCALNFACLDELVKDGVNGLVFSSAEQLVKQLESLLIGFPSPPTLDSLRTSLVRSTPIHPSRGYYINVHSPSRPLTSTEAEDWEWCSWAQNWDKVMRPLILTDVPAENVNF